jgi:peptidoglycan hydrolase CwlO-like protein
MVTLVDTIIPDSPSDFGAILFWVLIILLAIIVIIDIHTYLHYRKTSKKIEKPQQKPNTIEQTKKSTEDRLQEIDEIRNKVDKIIEINKM